MEDLSVTIDKAADSASRSRQIATGAPRTTGRRPGGRCTAALIAMVCAVACTGMSSCAKSCNAMGAYPGVNVTFDLGEDTRGAVTDVRVCAGSDCQSQNLDRSDAQLFFSLSELRSAEPTTISVEVRDAQGRQIAGGSTTVTAHQYQPNGPGCDPTVWQAEVTVSGSGVHESS